MPRVRESYRNSRARSGGYYVCSNRSDSLAAGRVERGRRPIDSGRCSRSRDDETHRMKRRRRDYLLTRGRASFFLHASEQVHWLWITRVVVVVKPTAALSSK